MKTFLLILKNKEVCYATQVHHDILREKVWETKNGDLIFESDVEAVREHEGKEGEPKVVLLNEEEKTNI